MPNLAQIKQILEANKQKNFVQRILMPENYPKLNNGDGTFSTHSMAYGEADGKYYVYPTVVPDATGELKRLAPDAVWQYTQKSGDFILFNTLQEAEAFSKEYKKVWGEGKRNNKTTVRPTTRIRKAK